MSNFGKTHEKKKMGGPKLVFFHPGFLSQPFTNHRTAVEGGGHFFYFTLSLLRATQTLSYAP